jgi:hypothetical protein
MGWLRIVRPGSVIGDQQPFLCSVEEAGGDIVSAAATAAAAVSAHACRSEGHRAASEVAKEVADALQSPVRAMARAARVASAPAAVAVV